MRKQQLKHPPADTYPGGVSDHRYTAAEFGRFLAIARDRGESLEKVVATHERRAADLVAAYGGMHTKAGPSYG